MLTGCARRSGSVCLDVINQTWSPMYDMVNIFEVFLPQLLRYPNPTDPLNGEAAALMMRDPKGYDRKVQGEFLNIPGGLHVPGRVSSLATDLGESRICVQVRDQGERGRGRQRLG